VVSSTTGTVSLVVDNNGNVYNRSRGTSNTTFGDGALRNNNISTYENTAVGVSALITNTLGTQNTAIGDKALYSNIDGNTNTAIGGSSLYASTGNSNTALGYYSFGNLSSGNSNIAIGVNAGRNIQPVGILTAATNSIFIGTDTGAQQNGQTNQIVIGHGATGNGSNTVTLGNNDVVTTYLKGNVQTNGTMTATGFFNSSDARLKDIIERDGDTVKFTWKDKRDDKVHIGYIAQEVQEKYTDQVNENEDGMLTVNYIEVLVAKIQELENRIKQLEK
jgi:hypothetical protein